MFLADFSFASFNVLTQRSYMKNSGTPVIIISRVKPNSKARKRTLELHFEDWQSHGCVFEKSGLIHKVAV